MRLAAEPLLQSGHNARLADAGLSGDEHDLTVPCLGARPATQQQVDLLVAANQRAQRRAAQRLETACNDTLSQHLPAADRRAAADGFECAALAAVEQVAGQASGRRVDRHRIGLCR